MDTIKDTNQISGGENGTDAMLKLFKRYSADDCPDMYDTLVELKNLPGTIERNLENGEGLWLDYDRDLNPLQIAIERRCYRSVRMLIADIKKKKQFYENIIGIKSKENISLGFDLRKYKKKLSAMMNKLEYALITHDYANGKKLNALMVVIMNVKTNKCVRYSHLFESLLDGFYLLDVDEAFVEKLKNQFIDSVQSCYVKGIIVDDKKTNTVNMEVILRLTSLFIKFDKVLSDYYKKTNEPILFSLINTDEYKTLLDTLVTTIFVYCKEFIVALPHTKSILDYVINNGIYLTIGDKGIINMNYKFLGVKDDSHKSEMGNSFEGKTLLMILVKNYKSSITEDILSDIRVDSPPIKNQRLHNDLFGYVKSILKKTDPSKINEYIDIRNTEQRNVFDIALLNAIKYRKSIDDGFNNISSIPKEILDTYTTTIKDLLDKDIDISNFAIIEKNDDYNTFASGNSDLQPIYNMIKLKYSDNTQIVDAIPVGEAIPVDDPTPVGETTNENEIPVAQPITNINDSVIDKLSPQCKQQVINALSEKEPRLRIQGGNKSQKKRKMRKNKTYSNKKAKKTIKKNRHTRKPDSRRTHKKKLNHKKR